MVTVASSLVPDPAGVDLSAALGVPAWLDLVDGSIEFGVSVGEVDERFLRDLAGAGVLAAPDTWPSDALAMPTTRLYRRLGDAEVLRRQGLSSDEDERGVKLDVTVLLPLEHLKRPREGDEFPKTIGHYHTLLPGEGVPSPDLYQVVWGEGIVLGQYTDLGIVKSLAIRVARGDTVLLPPHLGHLTINTGNSPLVFANVCVRCPHLSYSEHLRHGGGSWLFFLGEDGAVTAHPNGRMLNAGLRVGALTRAVPAHRTMEWLGLEAGDPIIKIISSGEEALSVLERPSRHVELFASALEHRE